MAKQPNQSLRRKRSARLAAIQGLYSNDILSSTMPVDKRIEQLISQWKDSIDYQDEEWPSTDMPERAMLTDLISGVSEHVSSIDETMGSVLKEEWKAERMNPVMIAILRCAIYELAHHPKRNEAIIADEYVTIASGFFEGNELGFVHSSIQQLTDSLRNNV